MSLGLLAGVAVLLSSCDRSSSLGPAPERLILVEVPRGALDEAGFSFREPYPSGARVVVCDPQRPDENARWVSAGFDAAGAPSVDAAGQRLLFVGRRTPQDPWQVYEVALDGGRPRAISPPDANATSACWLAGGAVVYACDLEGTLDPLDGGRAFSLYVDRRDGSEPTRITFGLSSEVDPTVLADGRVLYAVRQDSGPGREAGSWSFLTVSNDGTGAYAFHGSHHEPTLKRRPRQVGARVLFPAGEATGGGAELAVVSMRRPLHERSTLASAVGATWRSAEDLDGARLLVTHRAEGSSSFGAFALDPESGQLDVIVDDPDVEEVDAVLARTRPVPRGKLSLVDPDKPTGELLVLDARLTDRDWVVDPGAGRPIELEVERAVPRTGAVSTPFEPATEVLGRAPLAADGSVFVEVPANTPLRLRTRDADGRVVLDSGGWIWVRPAEKRGCIGCHEDRERAPTNRFPEALAGDDPRPVVLGRTEVPTR
jgi:hypothetical protein